MRFRRCFSVAFLCVKGSGKFPSIFSADIPLLPLSDRDQGFSLDILLDQAVDLFGVVSLIHDIASGFSGSVPTV